MKKLFLILLIAAVISCSQDHPYKKEDTEVVFNVRNSEAQDLLNSNTAGSFNKDSIKIFFPRIGKEGDPANFSISEGKYGYELRINVLDTTLPWNSVGFYQFKISYIYILWGNNGKGNVDIIESRIEDIECKDSIYRICTRVKLNNDQEWFFSCKDIEDRGGQKLLKPPIIEKTPKV